MSFHFKKIFLLIAALSFCSSLFAQLKFSASISPNIIGKDETAELKFTVENATQVEEINAPTLKDFDVLSGPNQENGMQSINGNTTQYVSISYIVKPKSIGSFTIPIATAKADGKLLHSNNISIKVTKNPQGNNQSNAFASPFAGFPGFDAPTEQNTFNDCILKKGDNIQEKINKNIFIKAVVNKTSCYVGEPIVVAYKLYTRLQAESNVTKSPSFDGFSVIDLTQPNNNNYTTEKVDGREYNVYTLLKSQLYPLQSGQVELGSVETDNTIHFIKEDYAKRQANSIDDIFRDLTQTAIPAEGIEDHQATLQSKPVTISVKELPEDNKPASFKGAVGDFQLTFTLDKNKFTTDDAGKLSITISGAGNMTLINAPDISWPDGVESFDPKITDELDKTQVPVTGSKHFEYTFTVQKAGNYILPSIEFSYFDPKIASYKTVSTKPLTFAILPGTGKPVAPVNQQPVTNNSSDFLSTLSFYQLILITIIGLLIVTGFFFWVRKENRKQPENLTPIGNTQQNTVIEKEIPQSKNYLALSEEKLSQDDSKGFYQALNSELRKFLSLYLQLTPEEINKKRIAEEMDKKGVSIINTLRLQELMDDIEWQLYTPFAEHYKMQNTYEKASALIHSLSNSKA